MLRSAVKNKYNRFDNVPSPVHRKLVEKLKGNEYANLSFFIQIAFCLQGSSRCLQTFDFNKPEDCLPSLEHERTLEF